MFKKFFLRRRVKKIDSVHAKDILHTPEYLLALAECITLDLYSKANPTKFKKQSLQIIRRNVTQLTNDVSASLLCVEESIAIPQRLSAKPEHISVTPLDDFLTNELKEPVYIREVINNDLIKIKQLLSGISIYSKEDVGRYNYYVRKLQYLLADIYILLEAMLVIALH